jgi:hypothetical protein
VIIAAAKRAFALVSHDADVRDSKPIRAGLDALFPGRRWAMDNSPFDEFGIVLEAGVNVRFGADKFGGCHKAAPMIAVHWGCRDPVAYNVSGGYLFKRWVR